MTDQTGSRDTVVIHAVGNVSPRVVEYGESAESLFGRVHQKMKEGDMSFCHLERLFSTRGCLQYRDHNTWASRVDPENVKSLVFGGFNVVSLAGNRCFDYGPEALLDSIDVIRRNGMQALGVGKDIAEARTPVILERKGIKVGFLGYSSVLPIEYEAREGKPGCAPLRVSTYYEAQGYQPGTPPKIVTVPREDDVLAMEEDIRKLRKQVDAVVVSIHWGQDYIPEMLAAYQPIVGHRAVDAGADLILGHHGRIIRAIEIYKGRTIFYCVGTFAQGMSHGLKPPEGGVQSVSVPSAFRPWLAEVEPGWERNAGPRRRRYTIMAKCAVSKKGIEKVSFLICYTNQRAEPEFVSSNDPRFQEILQYIEPWCKQVGTTLRVEGDEVVVSTSSGK
ncbi:MAG: CapA family protein [Chloroflexi bacterium]|nr:CapA family protein [Chloroflexota bacterium]